MHEKTPAHSPERLSDGTEAPLQSGGPPRALMALVMALLCVNLSLFVPRFLASDGEAPPPPSEPMSAPATGVAQTARDAPARTQEEPPKSAPAERSVDSEPAPPTPVSPEPPPPPSERGPSSEGGDAARSFELFVGVALLDSEPAELRLDPAQRRQLRDALANGLSEMQAACLARASLQKVLSSEQVQYLASLRGGETSPGPQAARPSADEVLALLVRRRRETASASPQHLSGGEGPTLGESDLERAPLQLEQMPALRLSPSQAESFHAALLKARQAQAQERALVTVILQILRPQQRSRVYALTRTQEVLHRTSPLDLVIATLSVTD